MDLFPRLRQSCANGHREASAQSARRGPLPKQINSLYLSGVLAADPLPDKARGGKPVLLLLVAFPAPDPLDTDERAASASCEVEVPQEVIDENGGVLTAGQSIFVTGHLSGGGGVLATEVHSGPAAG